jgi:hypothetical protein
VSAHAIWNELRDGGWPLLSRWRAEKKSEGLHLEFKQGAFEKDDVRRDDLKNLPP